MKKFLLLTLSAVVALSACKKDDEDTATPSTGNPALDAAKSGAVSTYANIVYASYADALGTAQLLKTAIDEFVADPTQVRFDACKTAWLASRIPYGQTEAYRFADGPIDDANGPEGLMNSWPLDEAYIDYVVGNANAGIVNSSDPALETINEQLITDLNQAGGETNVSTGYHAIEFLLWGQDLSAVTNGQRPYTDYTTAANAARRGAYLQACAALLVHNLQYVNDAWAPGSSSNYRHSFEHGDVNTALKSMMQGMGFLSKGELAGERMEVAYDSQLQEDEHSCFSDNTHIDIRMNATGIKNIYFGTYTRIDGTVVTGTSLKDVLNIANSSVATTTGDMITHATDDVFLVQAPFDQQILSTNEAGRATLHTAIVALKASGDQIAVAASALGLTIITE